MISFSHLSEVVVGEAGVGAGVVEADARNGVHEVGVDVAAVPSPLHCVHL